MGSGDPGVILGGPMEESGGLGIMMGGLSTGSGEPGVMLGGPGTVSGVGVGKDTGGLGGPGKTGEVS